MSKVQNRIALDSNARNLVSAFEKIGHYAEVMKLPNNIRNKAKSLYKQFEEKRSKTMRGTKKEAIIAAVLYMACKEELVPRTFKELAKETGIKEKDIRKFYRNLTQLLPKTVNTAQAVSPVDLVNRFCSKLKLPHEIVTAACAVADKATPQLEGKSPSSIAAASILMVTKLSDQKRWEKDIAEAASISPTTIRNVYKEMQMLPGLLPVENGAPKPN
jgi:transcription initiation factor TFIIB